MILPVAVQLYTIREETEKNFIGALEKVAKLGYKGVEFAGFGGIASDEMKKTLDNLGLKAVGSHTGMDLLENKLDEVIEYNLTIGNKYVICPWAGPKSVEEYRKLIEFFIKVGQECRDNGLYFAYHNHAHEFELVEGIYGLDYLYRETPSELLKVELDTFWVEYAGVNASEYLLKYSGRCPLVHLKDMDSRETKSFSEVGNGVIDIKAIVSSAEKAGAEWVIVEQDSCKRPPLESIGISIENLKKLKLA